jgi:hypothetical protein
MGVKVLINAPCQWKCLGEVFFFVGIFRRGYLETAFFPICPFGKILHIFRKFPSMVGERKIRFYEKEVV